MDKTLGAWRRMIEKALGKYWSEHGHSVIAEIPNLKVIKGKLAKAMYYSVFADGKRFRPLLCLATAQALGGQVRKVLPYACAVEFVHTFTLIHDDLPAMDNADFRRGRPSCHKIFGEAVAILAGDALNTLAFWIISSYPEASKELAAALLKVVQGQVLDLETTGQKLSFSSLKDIHRLKTAALLEACVRGSALICKASPSQLKALTKYAQHLGLAFQIVDDLLDVTATQEELGKPAKADFQKGFPYLVGVDKARKMAEEERQKALAALKKFGKEADFLRSLLELAVRRSK